MIRYLVGVVLCGMLVACGDKVPAPSAPVESQLVSPVYQRFLTACSGITITDATSQSIAYGVCMGYVRGFADGHQVTVDTIQRANQTSTDIPVIRLWCIPPSTTNSEVMKVVVQWIATYPSTHDDIMRQFNGINAATAVVVKSLMSSTEFNPDKCKQ